MKKPQRELGQWNDGNPGGKHRTGDMGLRKRARELTWFPFKISSSSPLSSILKGWKSLTGLAKRVQGVDVCDCVVDHVEPL